MNNITYAVSVDVNNPTIPYNVYVASVLDSNVRYLEITLYQNGNVIALSNTATATASLVTDNVLIDDSVNCTISDNIITVPLEDLQRHGNLDIQVTVTEDTKVLAIPFPIQVRVTPNIAENAQIDENSSGSYAEVVHEIAEARGTYTNLKERLDHINAEKFVEVVDTSDKAVDSCTSPDTVYIVKVISGIVTNAKMRVICTPNVAGQMAQYAMTKDGYIISRKFTASKWGAWDFIPDGKRVAAMISTAIAKKADRTNTLAGYGITDAYTREKTNEKLAQKLDSMPFDSEPKYNSPCYLTSGTVYNALLAKADKTETDTALAKVVHEIAEARGTYTNLKERLDHINAEKFVELKDTLNQFMNTYPNVDASNLTWLNVKSLGVDNSGADTTLGMLLFYPLDNRTLYFPKGTYKCNGLALENVENLTIICDNAEFIYCNKATDNTDSAGTSVQSTFFKFTGCKNLTIIDGNFDGKNKVSQIITLINCPNANIDNVNISNAGNASSATAAGINFLRNCSHFNVRNAKISGIKAGAVGSDGYIHSFGIGVSSAGNEYSQHGNIVNVRINDIDGYNSGDVKPDGDGIYLIERPTDDFSGDGYINISRCEIKGCAKRGIKISTRHVNISDCYVDVDSWGSAIEAQYGKLTLRDSTIKNRYASCLTLDWDNGTNYVDNCELYGAGKGESSKYGNYKGNGIVLNQRLSSRDEPYSNEPCNISINNCFVDGVFSPIISGYDNNIKYKYGNIVVDNLKIGHYRDASAIKLNPTMMTDVNRLVLSDIMYQYGTTEVEVLNANNEYYALSNTVGTTINLGTLSSYVNPKRLVYDTNLTDDYNEIFKFYDLNNADFGGETAKVTDVLEDSPNSADIADGTYTSATNTNLSVSVADGTMNVACSTAYASASYVYIPISSITLDGNVFDFVVSDISKTTADVTITFADAKKNTIAGLTEFALNKTLKSTIVGNVSGTASFVRIKLNADKTASLSCKISFKNRKKVLKGQVEERLKILEEKIKVLEGASV